MRKRVKLLDKELEETAKKRAPLEETLADCKRILSLETLKEETDEYFQWLSDMDARQEKLKEKEKTFRTHGNSAPKGCKTVRS